MVCCSFLRLHLRLFNVFRPKIMYLVIQSDLFGMVKWPFKGLSDLQLGDKNVTLNHLVYRCTKKHIHLNFYIHFLNVTCSNLVWTYVPSKNHRFKTIHCNWNVDIKIDSKDSFSSLFVEVVRELGIPVVLYPYFNSRFPCHVGVPMPTHRRLFGAPRTRSVSLWRRNVARKSKGKTSQKKKGWFTGDG